MNAKDLLAHILVESSVIPDKYTGQIIIHMGSGTICEVECVEKKKKLECLQDKKVLDIITFSDKTIR